MISIFKVKIFSTFYINIRCMWQILSTKVSYTKEYIIGFRQFFVTIGIKKSKLISQVLLVFIRSGCGWVVSTAALESDDPGLIPWVGVIPFALRKLENVLLWQKHCQNGGPKYLIFRINYFSRRTFIKRIFLRLIGLFWWFNSSLARGLSKWAGKIV